MRTQLAARITPDTQIHIDFMLPVGGHRNSTDGTMLRANRAADAVFAHAILNQSATFSGWAAALKVRLVFVPEIFERGEHGIRGGLAESAEAGRADLASESLEFGQIRFLALAGAQAIEDIQHPPGADAAKGAFPARLVLGELQKVTRDIYHACAVVEHD